MRVQVRTSEWDITEAMIRYGGSFVATLGGLIRKADHENKRRLWEAFPEFIQEYDELAVRHAEHEAAKAK